MISSGLFLFRWCIFFSHPYDFTPVCTTELAEAAKLAPEFHKRGVKMIALSVNPIDIHDEWIKDIKSYGEIREKDFPYPIIEDPERDIAKMLGMLDPDELDKTGIPLTCRAVSFNKIIENDKVLMLLFRSVLLLVPIKNLNCQFYIQPQLDVTLKKLFVL